MTLTWEVSLGNLLTLMTFAVGALGILARVVKLQFKVDLMWSHFRQRYDLREETE